MVVMRAPVRDQVVELPTRTGDTATPGRKGFLTAIWERWCTAVDHAWLKLSVQVGKVTATAQAAAIAATAIPTASLATGLYIVRYYTRITQAATNSSSLTVDLLWTDGGIACTQAGVALTGNTTATTQSVAIMVHIDVGTTLRYQTKYVSVGATAMQYRLDVVAEAVP